MSSEERATYRSSELLRQSSGVTASWESELVALQPSLRFVLGLEEQYVCPTCRAVVLNPHQAGCGHIFCYHCIQQLLEKSPVRPSCPLDGAVIKADEVFQDNCCKREISNLEVYCPNSPACTNSLPLCRLQDHLRLCAYEVLSCPRPGCGEGMQRHLLPEHLSSLCSLRHLTCPQCLEPQLHSRLKLSEHCEVCPEEEADCVYRKYGCSARARRGQLKAHEESSLSQHVLLMLGSTTVLETQMEALQEEVQVRHQVCQEESQVLSGLERQVQPLVQQVNRCDHTLSSVQLSLMQQKENISAVCHQIQQLSRVIGPAAGQDQLSALRTSLDTVCQQVSASEGLQDHLVALEENYKRHSLLLDIHSTQLGRHEERFSELEATSYDGRLIWKVDNVHQRRQAEVRGQPACLNSAPFHTGRCGYKLCLRAYLNGDGEGRGTHLSLYVVLMRGDFDPLLPWPFSQPVVLSLLDQGGRSDHRTLSFRPDPGSSSFQQPLSSSNTASGFSSFITHAQLETPGNAVYVRDDTMFIKVKVEPTGLDPL
ncbi:TNF receptor-associated factor 5 [Aplochiton taeniatus]